LQFVHSSYISLLQYYNVLITITGPNSDKIWFDAYSKEGGL